tara:strand:+ start:116 stop:433 length:318 start_codon:yes stop_codon:yes gene_type:complete
MNNLEKLKKEMTILPYSPSLEGVVTGIDLSKPLVEAELEQVHEAFLKYQVLFFQEQKEILSEIQVQLRKFFGPLHVNPAAPTMEGHTEIFEGSIDIAEDLMVIDL